MATFVNFLKTKSIHLWAIVAAVFVFVVSVGVYWGNSQSAARAQILDIVRDPIFLSVAGALVVFLLFDRWRKLEQDVAEVHKSQITTLKDIREDAEGITKSVVEAATRKAQAIESRIGSLVEDHPWIADITENEFIPDASSCRIVLRTAEQLLKSKPALAYEYLFAWAKRTSEKPPLEGTAEDFVELAEFCEQRIADEYLALLVLQVGHSDAANRPLISPYYLRRLLRVGRFDDAQRVARFVTSYITPTAVQRLRHALSDTRNFKRASFLVHGLTALFLFETACGRVDVGAAYLTAAKANFSDLADNHFWILIDVEALTLQGKYKSALELLDAFDTKSITDRAVIYDFSRAYRGIGNTAKSKDLFDRLGSRGASNPD